MNLSNKMLHVLRMRRDLDPTDESQDNEIMKLTPVQVVREMAMWELGDDAWADVFADWMFKTGAKPEDF